MRGVAAVFAVFAAGHWLSVFFRVANAVIAEDLSREMALEPNQLGLMTSLFFLTFAGAQLPLGAALDRYGARRVTAIVMLVGVAGALIFAGARSFGWLALGRALMGLGTAAGLMGGLKVLSGWFAPRRFPAASGALVAVGSSGAIMAATPLAWLNGVAGWRSVFVIGAVAFGVCALLIWLLGRDGPHAADGGDGGAQGGFAAVFRNPDLWLLALLGFAISGSTIAHQALWAGPYLTDGLGLSEIAAGNALSALAVGVVVGFFASGALAERFGLRRVVVAAIALFVAVQLALGFTPRSVAALTLLFGAFGFLSSFMILLLAEARALFPLGLTGRAVTAVNLFFFGGGFLLQWALGLLVERFEVGADGGYPAEAYGAGFLATAALCALALGIFLLRRRPGRSAEA